MSTESPRRVFIFVNGILNWPGDHAGWTDRAVTWTNTRTPHVAEKWEYACGAIFRRIGQQERAEKIATMMHYYEWAGFEIVLVGHSNGCDIIARVLALRGVKNWFYQGPVRSVHLISAAADGTDFAKALNMGRVNRVHLYCAGRDAVLQLARWSRKLFGWAGLGYGTLGLSPLMESAPAVTLERQPDYGHSDWFTRGENFERTMLSIHDNEKPDRR